MNQTVTLCRWTNPALVSTITELLHRAYQPLAAQGLRYVASYQDDTTTRHRLEQGDALLAMRQNQLVGTITLYPPDPASPARWYQQPFVWHFGQFAVDPCYQGHGIGQMLLSAVESRAADGGARELALDTAEHAHQLLRYYRTRGYREIEPVQWDMTNYRSIILSKQL